MTAKVPHKTCAGCKRLFSIEEYRWDNKAKGRRKSRCGECTNARQRDDRIKHNARRRKLDREMYARNADMVYRQNLMRRYGLTLEQIEQIKNTIQCDLCGEFSDGRKFVVDHCHETGKVRGLLCGGCNLGLGHFKDNSTLLREAARYIDRGGFGLFEKG